jgi:hypothetical protein
MSFGGGTFLTENKVLPGAYINFVSVSKASSTVSDRGYGAMAVDLDWGPDGTIFAVEQADFQDSPEQYFGYSYTDDEMKGLRDLFLNLQTGYFYRLNGGGAKALCDYCEAKYSGTRGNKIMVSISANVDDATTWDVETYFNGELKDSQTGVAALSDLKDNDFVTWTDSAVISATAGTYLTGGTNGTAATGADHSKFLSLLESYSINTLGCISTDDTIKALYYAYTKRMRDDEGAKFQCVLYNYAKANYEGVINVVSAVTDSIYPESSAVYWVTGAEASCAVNRTVGNKEYDGEFTITCETKQSALKKQINSGYFAFHEISGSETRVLKDINSFTDYTKKKTKDFSSNQVIRVLDQWANDTALIFEKTYLDKSQNIASSRVDLWNDLVDYSNKLADLGAIQDFNSKDITVAAGENKEDVLVNVTINPAEAMEKMYMYVYVA